MNACNYNKAILAVTVSNDAPNTVIAIPRHLDLSFEVAMLSFSNTCISSLLFKEAKLTDSTSN